MTLEGRRVTHPKYGAGTVQGKIGGAFLLLVRFDKGITFYVRRDECRFLEPVPKIEKTWVQSAFLVEEAAACPTDVAAACFVETLRLGIVPNDVSAFTFGRDPELSDVENWIKKDKSPPLLLVGDYGSGKTHLLECLKDKYLKTGWVVSSFQLDPNECPLHKPKRVYSRIIKSIKYMQNGEELGFRDLVRNFARSKSCKIGQGHLDCVLGICRHNDPSTDYVWDWIEGSGPITYYAGLPLYDDAPSANIYCSILSGIADLTREAGLSGFIILLDEAEQLSGSYYMPYQFFKGIDFFAGLSFTSSASDLLLEDPEVNDTPPPTLIGPKSGLPYSARNPVNYRRPHSSCFKVLFAFSEIRFLQGYLCRKLGDPPVVHLRPLGEKVKKEILSFLYEIYCKAYPGFTYSDIDQLIIDIVSLRKYAENVRTLIKAFLEALDIIRYYSISSHRSFLH